MLDTRQFTVFVAGYTVFMVTVIISAAVVVPYRLHVAAQEQCASRDWPTHQHRAHMDWCKAEGYIK